MQKLLCVLILMALSTLCLAESKTKEQISYEVESSHDYIMSSMNSSTSCRNIASVYVRDLKDAHQLFLQDSYIQAIINALNVTALSARKSWGNPECRSRAATATPHATRYLDYLSEHRGMSAHQHIPIRGNAPSDGDKQTLIALTDAINDTMMRACRSSTCVQQEKSIIYENNVLRKELATAQPDYEVMAYWLGDIKGIIGTFFSSTTHRRELTYIHEKNTLMLQILKPYLFQSQDFFETFNSRIIDLMIHEANPGSYCSHVLAQFFEMTLDSSHHSLPRLITTHNKLYEIIDESLYANVFYNSACTISKLDLFNLPFTVSDEVKNRVYAQG